MTLGELQAWILSTIKRPEKAAEVVYAINAAIEKASTQGDYAWDLVEGSISLDATVYAQSIAISSSFQRFRKLKYLRPSGYKKVLQWKDPSRIFDKGIETVDCWYRAGDNIIFKLCHLQSSARYAYYAYPTRLTAAGHTNNYTVQMPTVLHDLACARLYEDMGNEAEAGRLERRALRDLAAMRADRQDGVAHS